MYVSDAEALLAKVSPESPAQQMRFDLVLELLDDVRRLDDQTKESHRRIRLAVKASGTSLTEVYGVGRSVAAALIGYSGDIRSLRQPGHLRLLQRHGARSSSLRWDGRCIGFSMRGSRRLNNTLHMAAMTQIRNPGAEGRIYFERKVAEGNWPSPVLTDIHDRAAKSRKAVQNGDHGREEKAATAVVFR